MLMRVDMVLEVPMVLALQLHNVSRLCESVALERHVADESLPDTNVGLVCEQCGAFHTLHNDGHVGYFLVCQLVHS